jgi:hypothetical protein
MVETGTGPVMQQMIEQIVFRGVWAPRASGVMRLVTRR